MPESEQYLRKEGGMNDESLMSEVDKFVTLDAHSLSKVQDLMRHDLFRVDGQSIQELKLINQINQTLDFKL
jgi:hypothetical protein